MEEQNIDEQLSKKERRELRREEKEIGKTQRAKGKTLRRVVTWLVVILVLGGAIFAISKYGGQTEQSGNGGGLLSEAVSDKDRIKGSPELVASLVEYADFQCPACGAYHSLLVALEEEFDGKVSFVFRHFPLRSIHPNADMASRAAEAAGKQGKFWEMRDLLFENQNAWSNIRGPKDKFIEYAGSLGLDTSKFEDDLESDEVKSKIQSDIDSGIESGVNSTPSFFVNGEKISGPQSLENFRQVLNDAVARGQMQEEEGSPQQ